MRFPISYSLILLFVGLFGMPPAQAQSVRPSGYGAKQNVVESVDPHAEALLQQLNETYKAMHTFSTDWEEGLMGKDGDISFKYHVQLAFRRPNQLAFVVKPMKVQYPGPSKVIADGNHEYLLQSSVPASYTELFDLRSADSPFIATARVRSLQGVDWIENLLEGKGIDFSFGVWELKSLSAKRETFKQSKSAKTIPVETITARSVSTAKDSKREYRCSYTIGITDHLLYQVTAQVWDSSNYRIVRFLHPHADVSLTDSVFALPPDISSIPLLRVATSQDDTITFDKGSSDGLAVGDTLRYYVDEKMHLAEGELRVVEIQPDRCVAEVMESTVGIAPGRWCLLVAHNSDSDRTKRKPKQSLWLWKPEK